MGATIGYETMEFIFPPQVTNVSANPSIETAEAGPTILQALPESYRTDARIDVPYGNDVTLKIQYAYSKYPTRITWLKGTKTLDKKENCHRGGWTQLILRGVTASKKYQVWVQDTYNGKQDGRVFHVTCV